MGAMSLSRAAKVMAVLYGTIAKPLKRKVSLLYRGFFARNAKRRAYEEWIKLNEPVSSRSSRAMDTLNRYPVFSVVLLGCGKEATHYAEDTIASIGKQTYGHWNLHNAGSINELLSGSSWWGDYVVIVDGHAILSPRAFSEMAGTINDNPGVDLLYTDNDTILDGRRQAPCFKPEWSPDRFRSFDYIGPVAVLKKELLAIIANCEHDKDLYTELYTCLYGLLLEAGALTSRVIRIPKMLYHLQGSPDCRHSEGFSKGCHGDYCSVGLKDYQQIRVAALRKYLGGSATVESTHPPVCKVNYKHSVRPLVSIVIPNRDHSCVLDACLKSIISKTTYDRYEIVIVENGSRQIKTFGVYARYEKTAKVRVIPRDGDFNFSAVNNFGAGKAGGEVLLFLNNDTELLTPAWLEEMLGHALRSGVGAVGAKLCYPDGTIQHAGVVTGMCGIAGHPQQGEPCESDGYLYDLRTVRNVSAVTGACLMVRHELFGQAGGFDEDLALAYNDVDLCLKLAACGHLTIWTPYAVLIHHESKTRGYDLSKTQKERLAGESSIIMEKWGRYIERGDPYYNPNLTLDKQDLSFNLQTNTNPQPETRRENVPDKMRYELRNGGIKS
ncbi:MAG: glycosyltransferase family 2 protein [Nitrospirae bacterium]|nr:glycosyltransferase family 2 protein [Nitrospirota bacterium]